MRRIECPFLLRPLEPLFFGRPKSFAAGEARHGKSEFPPSPMAFQGIVRSHFLRSVENPRLDLNDWSRQAKSERKELVGGPDSLPGEWQIKGPYPACTAGVEDEFGGATTVFRPWVPTPLFLLEHGGRPVFPRIVPSGNPCLNDLAEKYSSTDVVAAGRPELDACRPLGGWIGPGNLRFALEGKEDGQWDGAQFADGLPPFVHEEHQPGVAIDNKSGAVKEGMLYALRSLRFAAGAGLAGWFDGRVSIRIPSDALTKGAAGAGRKNRAAVFEEMEDMDPDWSAVSRGDHIPEEPEENRLFWMAALSPARVADPLAPEVFLSVPPGVRLLVRGAVTGSPLVLGGLQMATGRTRPNRLYLPGGSCWLIQVIGADPSSRCRLLKQLNNSNALGPRNEASFGFGHVTIGIGPKIEGE